MFELKKKTWVLILVFILISISLVLFYKNQTAKTSDEVLASQTNAGGDMTVKNLPKRSFVIPGKGTTRKQQLDFWTGFSLFRDPWVTAPSTTKDRDGLGPLFNARSCIACHQDGGRSAMSEEGESLPTALIIRLGFSKPNMTHEHNAYGGQMQPRVTKNLSNNPQGEAWLNLSYSTVEVTLDDGESYELQKPAYELTRLAYGDLPEHALPSPRFAPNIFGTGLLDAIDEDDLLIQEDVDDKNDDGISAKYNRVLNVKSNKVEVGRFGLKAKHPNLAQQVAAAFRDDIGITNSFFPTESCTEKQALCHHASKLGGHDDVEIPDKLLDLVITFNRLLGVPPARTLVKPEKKQGQEIFHQLGCAQCHTPSYTTDKNYSDSSLAGQKIWPYTDLALHDMGEGLADGVYESKATGVEWKTPPLWGIGMQETVTGQQRFLHDGRARNITEAILWHGGEAKTAQIKFRKLTKEQRQALLMFLKSI